MQDDYHVSAGTQKQDRAVARPDGHRDLAKDLELCKKASPGPWVNDQRVGCMTVYPASIGKVNCLSDSDGKRLFYKSGYRVFDSKGSFVRWEVCSQDRNDAEFIAEAREGWPHAIERAMRAEKMLSGTDNSAEANIQRRDKRLDQALDKLETCHKQARTLMEIVEELMMELECACGYDAEGEVLDKIMTILEKVRRDIG